MAEDDFQGSIAQNNLTFSISTTIQTVVGSNYYTPMIFIGDTTSAATNIVDPPSAPAIFSVNASNFSTLTEGDLLDWLTSYFAVNNGLTSVNIVVYDSDAASYAGLTIAYDLYKTRSYQKFIFEIGVNGAAKIKLGHLCAADTLLSQFWTGSADTNDLVVPLTTGLAYWLANASPPVEAYMVYSAQDAIEPALTALGLQLSYLNASGVSVGNAPDYNATGEVLASGTSGGSDNSNLSPTQMANLGTNGISYYMTVGNGTGQVAIIGDQTTTGGYQAAQWFESYLQYKSQVDGASYLTTTPRKNKTETTYNGLIATLQNNAYPFTQGSQPIISNFQLVNFPFISAPASAGNTFIITGPNGYAWTALFNRGLSFATVTGNLTIQA